MHIELLRSAAGQTDIRIRRDKRRGIRQRNFITANFHIIFTCGTAAHGQGDRLAVYCRVQIPLDCREISKRHAAVYISDRQSLRIIRGNTKNPVVNDYIRTECNRLFISLFPEYIQHVPGLCFFILPYVQNRFFNINCVNSRKNIVFYGNGSEHTERAEGYIRFLSLQDVPAVYIPDRYIRENKFTRQGYTHIGERKGTVQFFIGCSCNQVHCLGHPYNAGPHDSSEKNDYKNDNGTDKELVSFHYIVAPAYTLQTKREL